MELVTAEWRSGFRTIGIILFKDSVTGKFRARMDPVPGHDEAEDIEHIRDYGYKMLYREALGFFPQLKEEDYKR